MSIYPKVCCIQTADAQWKLQFGSHTKEYAQIAYLAGNGAENELKTLAALMFYTRLVVADNRFLTMYQRMLAEFFKDVPVQEVSKEEDDKILEDEKKKNEKTERQ